jgi:hypothetical protein
MKRRAFVMKRLIVVFMALGVVAAADQETWEQRVEQARAHGVYEKNEDQVLFCQPVSAVLRKAGDAIVLDYTVTIVNPFAFELREFQGCIRIMMRHGAETVEFFTEFFTITRPVAAWGNLVHTGSITLMKPGEAAKNSYSGKYFDKNLKRFYDPGADAVIQQVNYAGPVSALYSIFIIEFADGFKWDWGK